MAFKIVGSAGVVIDQAGIELPATTDTAFAVGDILQRDTANNYLERATSGAAPSDANTGLFGLCKSVKAAATNTTLVVPLIHGMLLEADLANNSSTAHNLQRMALTDHDTLNIKVCINSSWLMGKVQRWITLTKQAIAVQVQRLSGRTMQFA